jgi:threonyl-tRNA synthetase
MNDKLHNIRHSLAHLLAIEVLKFDPEARLAIGPVIDTGFYYDFEFSEDKVPNDKNLKEFQKGMRKAISKNLDFEYNEISPEEARAIFKNNPYKMELIEELVSEGKTLSTYKTGDFVDLCSGPHVENTSEINAKAFKVDKIAGAYWRGDEKNTMLTRIYGLAFESEEELKEYETQIEEAKKRDHRKIGKEMGLFVFSPLVGAGLPLFTPKGTAIRKAIIEKINNIQKEYGYQEVCIPHITKPDLYKTSGHWEKFGDDLFKVRGKDSDFVIKPMNCPHHTQIFDSEARSYKDLPLRFVESTAVYRDEQSGELQGLSRVRSITQDDGHIFCTKEQMEVEIHSIVNIIKEFYSSIDMWNEGDFWVSLSTRDEEKMLGEKETWDMAEDALKKIAEEEKLPYKIVEGEAAFYGPKLDFMFKDSIGREWQLGTVQLDFVMPKRFNLEYTTNTGTKETPVMIHRAIAGSLERFMSLLIEHFTGNFPFDLAPVQIRVLPIAESHNEYSSNIYKKLKELGYRVELDDRNESLGKKVRESKKQKVPYYIVIGDKDIETDMITVENRDTESSKQMKIEDFIKSLE